MDSRGMALRRPLLRRRVTLGSVGVVAAIILTSCTINLSGATVLEMDEGPVVETFEFEALDPSERAMTVVVTAPTDTEVSVRFSRTDGTTMDVFQTPTDPGEAGCTEEPEGFFDCVVDFPRPQPGEPGTWTARVHKITFSPAEVHVNIAWDDPGDG